jgi:streptomycin 6-kinase
VLKLSFPHRESEHEADALARWDGAGAVRLLAHDRKRTALLLERCRPGSPLSDLSAPEALAVFAGLVSRLAVPAGAGFRTLADEAAWWMSYLPERWKRSEPDLLRAAMDALVELSHTQGEQVLVHQDLHAGNVLRAEREPWLVIDPKPSSASANSRWRRSFAPRSSVTPRRLCARDSNGSVRSSGSIASERGAGL